MCHERVRASESDQRQVIIEKKNYVKMSLIGNNHQLLFFNLFVSPPYEFLHNTLCSHKSLMSDDFLVIHPFVRVINMQAGHSQDVLTRLSFKVVQ